MRHRLFGAPTAIIAMLGPPAALIALLIAPTPALANSRYSLRGVGESILPLRADARALGGAETAAAVATVTGNPANLALADRAIFYGTWETEWVKTEESVGGEDLVRKDYVGLLPNLCVAYPLPGGVTLGTGLLVDRRQGGRIERVVTTPSGRQYRQIFEANGNLLRIPALLAFGMRGAQVGAGLDVLLLNSEIRWQNDFGGGSDFTSSDDFDRMSLWGAAWKVGLRVPVGSKLAAGAWLSWPTDLSGTRRLENNDPTDSTDDLEVDAGGEVAAKWAFGVDVKPLDRMRFVVDWVHEDWGDVTPISPIDEYVNVDRFGGGFEWAPTRGGLRWPVRVGYRTERLHVRDAGGRRVREHVFSTGSGFGVAAGRGSIDWYLEYGRRGDRDESEYFEEIVRFGVTLTGGEKWTRRRPPEDDGDW